MLNIWKNQAHDKTKWTLKISGPFILLHLNFLVCQMWAIVPLHLKNYCTNTSVKRNWGKLLILFGGVQTVLSKQGTGPQISTDENKLLNSCISKKGHYIYTEWSRKKRTWEHVIKLCIADQPQEDTSQLLFNFGELQGKELRAGWAATWLGAMPGQVQGRRWGDQRAGRAACGDAVPSCRTHLCNLKAPWTSPGPMQPRAANVAAPFTSRASGKWGGQGWGVAVAWGPAEGAHSAAATAPLRFC